MFIREGHFVNGTEEARTRSDLFGETLTKVVPFETGFELLNVALAEARGRE